LITALFVGAASIGLAETNGLSRMPEAGLPTDAAFQATLLPPVPAGTERENRIVEETLAEFSASQRDEIQALLEQHFPDEMRTFRQMLYDSKANPRAYLVRLTGEAARLLRIRVQDPRLYRDLLQQKRLQREATAQARLVVRSQGLNRSERKEKLNEVLAAEFDIRQRLMAREVASLEAELANLKALLQKRKANRDGIIERRSDELTGEGENLEW
jgi:hypothetical protein